MVRIGRGAGVAPSDLSVPLMKVTPETQQDAAYRAVREAILDGNLQPEADLSVRALSEALQVGTMPTRAAVQRLIAERGLEFTASRTIRVPTLTRPEFADLLSAVTELESALIRRAIKAISREELANLRRLAQRLQSEVNSADHRTLLRLTREFWFTLYRHGGSPVLLQLIENLWLRLSPVLVHTHARHMTEPHSSYDNAGHYAEFVRLLDALEQGSVDAALEIVSGLSRSTLTWFSANYRFRESASPGAGPNDEHGQ